VGRDFPDPELHVADVAAALAALRAGRAAVTTLAGLATLAASLALLRAFRPAPGQLVQRPEWVDIWVAITVTGAMGGGAMLTTVGIANLLSP
jgi:hypothetical protein